MCSTTWNVYSLAWFPLYKLPWIKLCVNGMECLTLFFGIKGLEGKEKKGIWMIKETTIDIEKRKRIIILHASQQIWKIQEKVDDLLYQKGHDQNWPQGMDIWNRPISQKTVTFTKTRLNSQVIFLYYWSQCGRQNSKVVVPRLRPLIIQSNTSLDDAVKGLYIRI